MHDNHVILVLMCILKRYYLEVIFLRNIRQVELQAEIMLPQCGLWNAVSVSVNHLLSTMIAMVSLPYFV